jgi:hypothetical protein
VAQAFAGRKPASGVASIEGRRPVSDINAGLLAAIGVAWTTDGRPRADLDTSLMEAAKIWHAASFSAVARATRLATLTALPGVCHGDGFIVVAARPGELGASPMLSHPESATICVHGGYCRSSPQ